MDARDTQQTEKSAPSAPAHSGADDQPWYTAFPLARSEPKSISRQEVLELLKDAKTPNESAVLVDLRRTDYEASALFSTFSGRV